MSVLLISLILGILVLLYFYLTRNYNYWQKRGIPCPDGALPGLGHMSRVLTMRITLSDFYRKIYNDNKNRSMVGIYDFTTPTLMIIEPELVKTVLQTKFTSFSENGIDFNPELDPLLAHHPFFITGERWVTGRKNLSYAFSGMRLRVLLEGVKQAYTKLEHYLDTRLNKAEKIELELKDLFARYTAQVVSGVGFGVEGFCFDDERKSDSFHEIGKEILHPTVRNNIVASIAFFVPVFAKIFKVRFIPKKTDHFFRKMVADVMEHRRTTATPRNDFLQLMVELERMEGDKFDLDVLASHALSFFADGYETSSVVISFVGYQLAVNPKVQKKLREEVTTVLAKYDGTITYDALKEMTYMDQVISETQRILPTVGFLKKKCTEHCELRGADGLLYRAEPGMEIIICLHGLQTNPQYWNDPEKFDPERFDPDRKQNLQKFAFLPFGEGPRICVGMRMALLQSKACLASMLKKYRLEISSRTQRPLKLTSSRLLNSAVGGLWVHIRPL